jgi:competence protein ComEC
MGSLLPYFLAYLGGLLAALPPAVYFFTPYLLPAWVAGSGFFIFSRSTKQSIWRWLFLVLLLPCGYFSPEVSDGSQPANHILNHIDESRRTTLVGTLIETPEPVNEKMYFNVEASQVHSGDAKQEATGRVRLTHYHPDRLRQSFQAGDVVRFTQVRLKRPRNFRNPGAFDYLGYLKAKGISVIGSLSKNSSLEKLGAKPLPFLKALQVTLRGHLLQTLDTQFSGQEAALLKGMLLGQKNALSDAVKEAYIATGLAHLLAVSGLHVGFVAWSAFIIFWPLTFHGFLKYRPEWAQSGAARKIAASLCLLPVLFYLLLVGPKITALRAGFLVIVFLFAIVVNRERNLFNALIVAAFLILIWNPRAVLDVSFQLSFSAMMGVLFVVYHVIPPPQDPIDRMGEQPWYRRLSMDIPNEDWNAPSPFQNFIQSVKKFIATSALISLAVYLCTLPFLIFHFNRVSLIGIVLNLIMIPLASILIPLALFAISLGSVLPALGWILSFPLHLLLKCFLVIPQFFASFSHASLYVPTPPRFWVLLYFSVLLGSVWMMIRKPVPPPPSAPPNKFKLEVLGKAFLITASLVMIVWLIWPRFPERPSETLQVSILDVGQGESIFIEFPNRETMILDGGGFYKSSLDVGKMVVAPFLWNRGIGRIDYLAATHSDQDHISGLESLVDLFSIGHFLDGFSGIDDSRIENLRKKTLAKQAHRITLQPGHPLTIGEVQIVSLHPNPQFLRQSAKKSKNKVGNESSLVLRLDYRDFSILLTGDIGKSTEDYLIKRPFPLKASFLKSPHHGSRFSNSPAFIQAVQPQAVIFSSGYLNWMRHPHPEVVRRYQAAGTRIWRTDLDGSIHITTDGYQHVVQNYSKNG